jgi:hypothetical protein
MQIAKSRTLWVTALPALLLYAAAAAATPLPTGSAHRGLVTVGEYQVFPENRPGNGVYADGILLFSSAPKMIVDVAALPGKGRFVYLTQEGDQKPVLAVRTLPRDPAPRMTEPYKDFYYFVGAFDGVGYKKFYRVQNHTVADLLPNSKTADGVTVGDKGILFFHIASTENLDAAGTGGAKYSLRLHMVAFDDERVHHLAYPIVSGKPAMTLKWLDETRFQYTLPDGRSEILSTSQMQ